ncbi:hypothetical protein PSU4_28240 [Pseudonocardia sulfidoxydans NBRC 16205]|uniref:HTH araC/xylS-type domain-containing protein n=1 Tax=Pseudonocardia sulfidoxydans NBRC 16205 TaxID=1223511 RepID=A0A511DGF5_9PSEU|nr:helix-turn-helix domain-containing protein [Pseudonocardia sulfidoxydans]GEL23870.1 hypothetical protein PSU4_28240 [Pseudonocardia sulfidoxydans NBRC 16205]
MSCGTEEGVGTQTLFMPRDRLRTLFPRPERLFADTGETPAGYLRRRRLERARDLMRTRPSPAVHEVGERCGFASPSAFSRAFRARFGETPREARAAQVVPADPASPAVLGR